MTTESREWKPLPPVLTDKQLARLEARIQAIAARIADKQAYHAQMCEVREFNMRMRAEARCN